MSHMPIQSVVCSARVLVWYVFIHSDRIHHVNPCDVSVLRQSIKNISKSYGAVVELLGSISLATIQAKQCYKVD